MRVCVCALLVMPTWLGHTCSRGSEHDGLLLVDAGPPPPPPAPLLVIPDPPVPAAAAEDEVVPEPWERLV